MASPLIALLALPTFLFPPSAPHGSPTRPMDLRAATALVARVVPGRAASFVIEQLPPEQGGTCSKSRAAGRIVLRGSNGVAIASALNWYLEHVAGITIAIPLRPITLAAPLPRVPAKVRITTPYQYRYFFNYCTFSYSMAWWDWAEWERMIDWMALKGINLPLAATGQEGTWRLRAARPRLQRHEIADFLVGPAYLPWGWMGNIDGLGGPLAGELDRQPRGSRTPGSSHASANSA